MARLPVLDLEQAGGKSKEVLAAVKAKLKMVSNMTKVMANSPAVLNAYLGFSGALAEGALDPKLRIQIALAVGESNECEYCVSAHTAIAKLAGLSDAEIASNRQGQSLSAKSQAALSFSKKVIANRGRTSAADVDRLRAAGFNDGEIAEIVANIALNIFTNYFNNIADVEVDFPRVAMRHSA